MCREGGGGGEERVKGWREIIACWCICVAGGSRVEEGVGLAMGGV